MRPFFTVLSYLLLLFAFILEMQHAQASELFLAPVELSQQASAAALLNNPQDGLHVSEVLNVSVNPNALSSHDEIAVQIKDRSANLQVINKKTVLGYEVYRLREEGNSSSSGLVVSKKEGGALGGYINLDGKQWSLRASGQSEIAQLYQISVSANDSCQVGHEKPQSIEPRSKDNLASGRPLSSSASNEPEPDSVLDYMVAYTPEAVTYFYGGTVELAETAAVVAVETTNDILAASGVAAQLRLVKIHGVQDQSYRESGNALTEMYRAQDPNDGYMDDIAEMRDLVGADGVALLIGESGLGVANLLRSNTPDRAYIATSVGHAYAGTLTFPHEFGHNLGCAHNRADTNNPGFYDFSYGFMATGNCGDTMSYAASPRAVYSSPNVLECGDLPMGTEEDSCVATFNQTRLLYADFRPERFITTETLDGGGPNGGNDSFSLNVSGFSGDTVNFVFNQIPFNAIGDGYLIIGLDYEYSTFKDIVVVPTWDTIIRFPTNGVSATLSLPAPAVHSFDLVVQALIKTSDGYISSPALRVKIPNELQP